MVSDWQEADRADRLRYSQPARLCGGQGAGNSSARRPPSPPAEQPSTLYGLLGVDRSASQAEIRRAYRRLLVTAHPDKGGDVDTFRRLKEAHSQLSDPTERLIYDERLERMQGSSSGVDKAAAQTSADPAAQACCRRGGGVTAVVHGQTQGTRQEKTEGSEVASISSAAAGDRSGNSRELSGLQEATAAIQRLLAASAPASSLAEAHLRRAKLHHAAGQIHHAIFDAEEALRWQPQLEEAQKLVAVLRQAGEGELQQQQACGEESDTESF